VGFVMSSHMPPPVDRSPRMSSINYSKTTTGPLLGERKFYIMHSLASTDLFNTQLNNE